MNELMIFEGNNVEVFNYDGKVLFNPKDVGKCLDMSYSTVKDHVRNFNKKITPKKEFLSIKFINHLIYFLYVNIHITTIIISIRTHC